MELDRAGQHLGGRRVRQCFQCLIEERPSPIPFWGSAGEARGNAAASGLLKRKAALAGLLADVPSARPGCVIWLGMHAVPSPRCDIRLYPSCKHFEKAANATPRCFIIDRGGVSDRLDSMPEDLKGWLLQKLRRDVR